MKKILLLLFQFIFLTGFCQVEDDTHYDLKYKLINDSLVYKFNKVPTDFDSIMNGEKSLGEDWDWAIKTGYERYVKNNYYIIKNDGNYFKIKSTIATDSLTFPEALNIYEFYIDERGNNYSIYLSTEIDMICGFIFRLPEKSVKIGDTWKTEVDDMSLGGYILKDSFLLKDEIKLTQVTKINDELIATITYNYFFYFSGNVNGEENEIITNYVGEGSFSISEGRWLSNKGIYTAKMSGLPDGAIGYELHEVNEVPTNLYQLEKQ